MLVWFGVFVIIILLVVIPFIFAGSGYEDKNGFHPAEKQKSDHLTAKNKTKVKFPFPHRKPTYR